MTETVIAVIGIVISCLSLVVSAVVMFFNKATLKEVKKQNEEVKKQNDRVVRSIESDTISKIAASQQNMLFQMLSNNSTETKEALKGFSKSGHEQSAVYGTIMINHLNMVYTFRQKGFLGDDEWIGLQNDIKRSFENMPILKERWQAIKTTYSVNFQKFIEGLVDLGRLDP